VIKFNKRQVLFISIALVAATLAAYEPIRHNDFVSYDDTTYITENPNVTGGITQHSIVWAFTTGHSSNWHPLTWLSHMLDYEIYGLNPLGHHITNVLIHIVNSLLLFWILRKMTGTIWTSAFVAGVFALHPLQVDSVAWAAEKKTVLSGLFWLLTIAVYIHYTKQPRLGRYLLLFVVFGFCIMTKPVVVTLPLVLLLLDYWPLERVKWGQLGTPSSPTKVIRHKASMGRLITEKIPLFALSAILCLITFVSQKSGGAVIELETVPLDYRIANMFFSYIRYIGKMIWPSRLAVFYPYHIADLSVTTVIICAALFALITILAIYTYRQNKHITTGWLWYVVTLVPVIGLVQAGFQSLANRYMYLPMLGLLIIIAWSAKDLIVKHPQLKAVTAVMGTIVLLSLLILTRAHVRHWQNSITLFEYALKTTTNNATAEVNYGIALLHEAGRFDEVISHLRKAVRLNPTFAIARYNLGKILLQQGKSNEAIECFNELLQQNGDSAEAHFNLAVAFNMQKKYDDAIKHLAKVLEIDPNYPDARNKMEITLIISGRTNDAFAYFNEILRTSKDPAEEYTNLGVVYTQAGKYELAIQSFTKAVELKPNSTTTLNNLAWTLATTGDVSVSDANKAVELAQHACELTGYKNPSFLDTLAAAYAAAGKFDDAVKTAKQALDIAKSGDQEGLTNEIQSHIKLYQAGQPHRQK
jgi:tetratricopeptide (TPR) repeat protein